MAMGNVHGSTTPGGADEVSSPEAGAIGLASSPSRRRVMAAGVALGAVATTEVGRITTATLEVALAFSGGQNGNGGNNGGG